MHLELKSYSYKDMRILLSATFLHDAYDHKYFNPKEVMIRKRIVQERLLGLRLTLDEIQTIFSIIDTISFSKEQKLRL